MRWSPLGKVSNDRGAETVADHSAGRCDGATGDQVESLISGRGDVRDDLSADAEAADERHDPPRLAGNVRAQIPRIRPQHKPLRGPVGAFVGPVAGRGPGGFQRYGSVRAEVADRVGDPVDVQLGM